MEYVVYIYSSQQPAENLTPFRCPHCGRPLFKTTSQRIFITNAYGASIADLPPSSNFIETKCHSCKALYSILFQ